MRLLSGVTYEVSRANCIVTEWLESLGASRVLTYPSQGSRQESTESTRDSGGSTLDAFARFNPDGSLLKTSPQYSLWMRDEPYSENLPDSGSMQNGSLSEHRTSEHRTGESGYSSWPTPRSADSEACGNHPNATDSLTGATRNWGTPRVGMERGEGHWYDRGKHNIEENAGAFMTNWSRYPPHLEYQRPLPEETSEQYWQRMWEYEQEHPRDTSKDPVWPTPDANGNCPRHTTTTGVMHPGTSLTDAIREWRTPNTRDHHAQGPRADHPQRQVTLVDQVDSLWTTPQAHDVHPGDPKRVRRMGTLHGAANLTDDVMLWPTHSSLPSPNLWATPQVSMVTEQDLVQATTWSDTPQRRHGGRKYSDSFLPAHLTQNTGSTSSESTHTSRRRLNPAFVSWLMGWPFWWTHPEPISFARRAMELWLYRAHWHLSSLRRGPGWKV